VEAAGPQWNTYSTAVARRFARDFPLARRGAEVTLESTLPSSAGLSSSSALVVVLAEALAGANAMDENAEWRAAMPTRLERAEYFAAMESGTPFGPFAGDSGVGTRGGAQDHVAIVCAEAGSVGQFSYLPARLERRIAWPQDYVLAVAVSGVQATKTGAAQREYNRASDALRLALGAGHGAATGAFSEAYLAQRLAQFREECEVIVPGVADALAAVDVQALGRLADRSQMLAEEVLENQVAETTFLARAAREGGAVAASAFGAGFGGAVWAMVRENNASDFLATWRTGYERAFPARAKRSRWIVTRPSAGMREEAAR
jgi:galactokinase